MLHVVTLGGERWDRYRKAADGLGLEVTRLEGVDPDDVPDDLVRRLTIDTATPRKKVAIRLAMRQAVLAVAALGGGTVAQDDFIPFDPLSAGPFVIHTGPQRPGHFCPRGFTVSAVAAYELAAAWSEPSSNACELWKPVIDRWHAEIEYTMRLIR